MSTHPMKWNGILSRVLFASCAALAASFVALIWIRYPSNHGGGPDLYRNWFLAFFIFSLVSLIFSRNLWTYATLAVSLLFISATYIADHRNIIVDYDEWIARGMPEWGTAKQYPSSDTDH
ncbi:MAG TPA: hypothetical protein PLA50_08455 [Bacteroidia bacterium]|nr:hypothetical protein [Bacteroidia bacterium]